MSEIFPQAATHFFYSQESLTLAPPCGCQCKLTQATCRVPRLVAVGSSSEPLPSEPLLSARHCSMHFMCLTAFNPYHNPYGVGIVTGREIAAQTHQIICQGLTGMISIPVRCQICSSCILIALQMERLFRFSIPDTYRETEG